MYRYMAYLLNSRCSHTLAVRLPQIPHFKILAIDAVYVGVHLVPLQFIVSCTCLISVSSMPLLYK